MKAGRLQAKDIPDTQVLALIRLLRHPHRNPVDGWMWVHRWDLEPILGFWYPEKVIMAKMRSLIRRGVVDGCPCGCRGDFEIIEDKTLWR